MTVSETEGASTRPQPSVYPVFTPETLVDPYPLYVTMQEQDPVYYSERAKAWILSRYSDVMAALRDPRLSSKKGDVVFQRLSLAVQTAVEPLRRIMSEWLILMDPPAHTRARKLVSQAFLPRLMNQMSGRIEEIARELLDAVAPRGRMELIADYAIPLPMLVMGDLLGVRREDARRLKHWSETFAQFFGSIDSSEQVVFEAQRALVDMHECLQEQIRDRRESPKDDFLTHMIQAQADGTSLTEMEVLAACTNVLVGGQETTAHLIGNGTLALLRHPAQLERLRRHPELVDSAVEEFMRYDGPAHLLSRVATEDLIIRDKRISKGERVIVLLGAASRDPLVFENPHDLDIGRDPKANHAAFGMGVHFCPGAPLARVEVRIAMRELIQRFPTLRLDIDEPAWKPTPALRGLKSLPLAWE